MNPPIAYLFLNGNAAFFDADGNQIVELQMHGWRGLHGFIKRYPDGDVRIQGGEVFREHYADLLSNIAEPENSK